MSRYDIVGALDSIRHELEKPHPTDVDQLIHTEGIRVARHIAAQECPTEAVRKTFGHAMIVGGACVGTYVEDCPHGKFMFNIQATAGYYLVVGLPPEEGTS